MPAPNARQGEPKRTTSAATRPLSPSSDAGAVSKGPLGAAAIAASAASPPTRPKAAATSAVDGNADDARALRVGGDRLQAAAGPRALER